MPPPPAQTQVGVLPLTQWLPTKMQLNNIRLPFDVDVHCRSGACWLRGAIRSGALKAGESVRVRAYRRFDLYTLSHSLIAASDAIHFDVMASRCSLGDESGDHSPRNWADDPAKPLTLKLARAVFGEPNDLGVERMPPGP